MTEAGVILMVSVLLAGTMLAGWWLLRAQRGIRAVAAQLERSAALRSEIDYWQTANARLAQWQELTEQSIGDGTRAVRALHKSIASIPFEILEAIPSTRDTSRVVRQIHDFTADNVYAAIDAANRLAGQHGKELLRTRRKPELDSVGCPPDGLTVNKGQSGDQTSGE